MKTIATIAIGWVCLADWFAAGAVPAVTTTTTTATATTNRKAPWLAPAKAESHLRVVQHTSRPVRPALAGLPGSPAGINLKGLRPVGVGGPARPGARTTMSVDGSGVTVKRRRVGP